MKVVGSRSFANYELLKTTLDRYSDIDTIVSGGAPGADTLGERYAREHDWKTYGKRAGFVRNGDIVDHSDLVIAFWSEFFRMKKSTKSTIDIAKRKGVACRIVEFGCKKVQTPPWAIN